MRIFWFLLGVALYGSFQAFHKFVEPEFVTAAAMHQFEDQTFAMRLAMAVPSFERFIYICWWIGAIPFMCFRRATPQDLARPAVAHVSTSLRVNDITRELNADLLNNGTANVQYSKYKEVADDYKDDDIKKGKEILNKTVVGMVLFLCLALSGCWKPYQPVVLETVDTSETAFLLPLIGEVEQQDAFKSEQYLEKNLVATKQVQIPHRWVQLGYEWLGMPNGKWLPSARLVKVDRAPVTREWTADEKSGTSKKDDAIWVMTSDSVAFSTGWTCTARIASTTDAVKFLFNYPSGSLETVLDGEVRAKLQAVFGLAVTDRPMDELRQNSTPIFEKTRKEVEAFFKERGITITNLGITGGYVHKDARIQETLNKVFQSQQDVLTATAAAKAQEQKNESVRLKAEGEAAATLLSAKAQADAIKMVADAKSYEQEKAKADPKFYIDLKKIEVENKKVEKWNGTYPTTFMGGNLPEMLLQVK